MSFSFSFDPFDVVAAVLIYLFVTCVVLRWLRTRRGETPYLQPNGVVIGIDAFAVLVGLWIGSTFVTVYFGCALLHDFYRAIVDRSVERDRRRVAAEQGRRARGVK